MNKDTPTWEFDRVELTYLRAIIDDNGLKSRNRCYASIDFGFFIVMNVGLTLERKYNDQITWSNDFGWSKFRFNMSQIDNPYYEKVIKVMRMIKEELDRKHDIIVDFLNDPNTMPKIIRDKYD